MSFRVRIGSIPKTAHDKYKDMSYHAVCECTNDDSPEYGLPEFSQLFDIGSNGKHPPIRTADGFISPKLKPFFCFPVDGYFYIADKEFLHDIIKVWHQDTLDGIEKSIKSLRSLIAEPHSEEHIGVLFSDLTRRHQQWHRNPPYWLDQSKTDGAIVSSWLYEYAIFNLVYIYRTFDFENNLLIINGW